MTIGGSGPHAYRILSGFFQNFVVINLWVSGIFFPKENKLVLFIALRHLVGRVRKQKPVDAPLQGLSFSPGLTSWIATHQKLRKKYPFPQDVGPVTFYHVVKKWQAQRTEGAGISFVTFWCVAIQEVKPGENESPCNGASTGFVFGPCRPCGAEL